jgi:hypothetical protein
MIPRRFTRPQLLAIALLALFSPALAIVIASAFLPLPTALFGFDVQAA